MQFTFGNAQLYCNIPRLNLNRIFCQKLYTSCLSGFWVSSSWVSEWGIEAKSCPGKSSNTVCIPAKKFSDTKQKQTPSSSGKPLENSQNKTQCQLCKRLAIPFISLSTAVRRHCTDWYEIWALTDHKIYYIKIELDLRKFSIGPFSETCPPPTKSDII